MKTLALMLLLAAMPSSSSAVEEHLPSSLSIHRGMSQDELRAIAERAKPRGENKWRATPPLDASRSQSPPTMGGGGSANGDSRRRRPVTTAMLEVPRAAEYEDDEKPSECSGGPCSRKPFGRSELIPFSGTF